MHRLDKSLRSQQTNVAVDAVVSCIAVTAAGHCARAFLTSGRANGLVTLVSAVSSNACIAQRAVKLWRTETGARHVDTSAMSTT